jgi:hypothetical protein
MKIFCAVAILTAFVLSVSGKAATNPETLSPESARNLIIYEIAPKGFTSPNGPESGTFTSLKAKLPYLEELGITAIWLAGHALADPHHFYNIWSTYASIDVSKLDPSLGTPEEFKAMIDEAHRRGIKIFLDVLTTGVMENSPVRKRHPQWFQGRTWGLTVYDWYGGHSDLDDWWVQVWSDYITKYGVDGFRIDSELMRPDLFARIRANATAAGHEIVSFEEDDSPIPGVTDLSQHENSISDAQSPVLLNKILTQDVPGLYDHKFGRSGPYQVEIQYLDDGSRVKGSTDGQGTLRVHLDGLTADKTSRRAFEYYVPLPDGIPDVELTVDGVATRPIENIVVTDDEGGRWAFRPMLGGWHLAIGGTDPLFALSEPPIGKSGLQIYVSTLAHGWPSIQLSCHDNGWEGFPLNKNPYVAQGSRAIFGYSFLFTPMVPVLFSGEEFDATYRPLPGLSPHLYGGRDAGKGRWLYGSMLDWDQLNQPEHRAMFEDVKKMIAVRKRGADILALSPDQKEPKLMAVPHEGDIAVPVPYIRWNERGAILVAANRDTNQDAHLKLHLPLKATGLAGHASYKITDLWPGSEAQVSSEKDLADFTCSVKRDKSQGGGLRVFMIEPNP